MGWFYATEEGEMYNSCLLYRRIHLISASWTSAFPIRESAILLAQAWHAGQAGQAMTLRPAWPAC